MWKKFLKKSGWTDIAISLIFILLGIMLAAKPETIMSAIALILGIIFITIGILKIIDYFSNGRKDNYIFAIAVILIIIGIIITFCSDFIISAFRIIISIWIIYSGIMNLLTSIIWKDYKSRLWLATLILSIAIIIAGVYVLATPGALLQTLGIIIIVYGIVDIIENVIFIKKIDDYLE